MVVVWLAELHSGAHVEQVTDRGAVVSGRDLGDAVLDGSRRVGLFPLHEHAATHPTIDLETDMKRCGVAGMNPPISLGQQPALLLHVEGVGPGLVDDRLDR